MCKILGLILLADLLVNACILCAADQPGDWPGFRGPNGDGATTEGGWQPEALGPTPKILWQTQVGEGYSQPCISGSNLYTTGFKGGTDTVYCLDVETGKEAWMYAYPCKSGSYPGTRATPLCDRGFLYTISRMGQLFCLDAETGEICWQSDLVKTANAVPPQWGISSSPRIAGDTLYLNVGQYGLAMEAATGRILWQSPRQACGYASPVLYTAGGERRALFFGAKACYGVRAKTGELLWSYPWLTHQDENSANPIYWKDQVFLSSSKSMYKSDKLDGDCAVIDLGQNPPTEVWKNNELASKFFTAVLFEGRLYGVHGNTGSVDCMLRCLDFLTGAGLWEYKIGRIASLIVVDGKLVVLSEDGKLRIAPASSGGYRELAQGVISNDPVDVRKETKGKFWTAPVLCRGLIFCRNDQGRLVCVSLRKGVQP